MKTWEAITEIPCSVSDYFEYFCSNDPAFSKYFHQKKGHHVLEAGNWQEATDLQLDPQTSVSISSFLKASSVFGINLDNLKFAHKKEMFRLPLPLPDYILKHVFGSDSPKGNLMQTDHIRPTELLKDGSVFIEAYSRPLEGMLSSKFHVHLLYYIQPHPENNMKSILKFKGQLEVRNIKMIQKAVETFAQPFTKAIHREWTQMMLTFVNDKKQEEKLKGEKKLLNESLSEVDVQVS